MLCNVQIIHVCDLGISLKIRVDIDERPFLLGRIIWCDLVKNAVIHAGHYLGRYVFELESTESL